MFIHQRCTPPKTNMAMENPPFEGVFPIENGDFPCHVSFRGCSALLFHLKVYCSRNCDKVISSVFLVDLRYIWYICINGKV